MPGNDTKISNTGTMRIMDLIDTRKTEEQENHTRTMEDQQKTSEVASTQRLPLFAQDLTPKPQEQHRNILAHHQNVTLPRKPCQ